MSLSDVLKRVVRILDKAEVPYMLTGSLAVAFYGVPRATQGVDIVVETAGPGIDGVVDGLHEAGYYVDREAVHEAQRTRGQFNAIEPRLGWKVDLIVRRDRPFSAEEFSRRHSASLLGVEISLASFEDVILAKLEWSRLGDSELQRRDVVALLERGWSSLDHAYLEHWARELGLEAEWKAAKARVTD